jgi:hypothetical protein
MSKAGINEDESAVVMEDETHVFYLKDIGNKKLVCLIQKNS